ncbi:MAG: NAD(P)/FAD-dependent oxidoreductase [Deltaproteobacteria bacterium]|nr:NAD(P)/FAD-dependent oxidoreductase [Deltaproteobacteria bacterium]
MSRKTFPQQTSVLIVGAGPAGLSAALALSRAGVDAVLIDARKRIGHPVRCAEMTHRLLFEILGVQPRPTWVRWVLGKSGLVVLNRPRLEEDLAGLCAEKGVGVFPETSLFGLSPFDGKGRKALVLHRGRAREVYAACVIAADGMASATARLAGLAAPLGPQKVASCAFQMITGAKPEQESNPFLGPLPSYPFPLFYFWALPQGRGRINAGILVPGMDGGRARFLLDRAIANTRAFSGGRPGKFHCGLLPLGGPLKRLVGDGILVTGTAARLVSVGGEGILPAAFSGREAARTVADHPGSSAEAQNLAAFPRRIKNLIDHYADGWNRVEKGMPLGKSPWETLDGKNLSRFQG